MQRLAVGDRTPQPLVLAIQHGEPGHVVNARAHVVAAPPVERAQNMGRRHGGDAHMVEVHTREERAFRVDDRGLARAQGEPIGARHALRIQHGVNHQRVGGERGLFDPDGAEQGELLPLGIGCANRQAARGDAVALAAGEGSEEARPLEDRHLGRRLPVPKAKHPETRKTQILAFGRRFQLTKGEIRRIIGEATLLAIFDDADRYRRGVNEATVQRLDGVAHILVGPKGRAGQIADGRILLVTEGAERLRQFGGGGLVGFFRQGAGRFDDAGRIEGGIGRIAGRRRLRRHGVGQQARKARKPIFQNDPTLEHQWSGKGLGARKAQV